MCPCLRLHLCLHACTFLEEWLVQTYEDLGTLHSTILVGRRSLWFMGQIINDKFKFCLLDTLQSLVIDFNPQILAFSICARVQSQPAYTKHSIHCIIAMNTQYKIILAICAVSAAFIMARRQITLIHCYILDHMSLIPSSFENENEASRFFPISEPWSAFMH